MQGKRIKKSAIKNNRGIYQKLFHIVVVRFVFYSLLEAFTRLANFLCGAFHRLFFISLLLDSPFLPFTLLLLSQQQNPAGWEILFEDFTQIEKEC